MTYSTNELIQILDLELKENWKGKRVVLSSAQRINDPVVEKALDMNQVNKVFAYRDFRSKIHEYQRDCGVSGIIWRTCTFGKQSITYPEIHNQLVPVSGDKEILVGARTEILDFWYQVTKDLKFWLVNNNFVNHQSHHQPISFNYLQKLIQQTEWAEIDAARTEIYLGLCWGIPQDHQYQWAKPKSGCDRIIATVSKPSAIKI
ncbi:hypothetical protein I4641_12760 [Waterburya agarophytonicola K14]|uniref:Uncharacterized protein n=1 Tax=Waterburya agarophytonicola KI4 TaxID=2874699 RepID=A0A964BSQ4_9CYAN|nr:hypothetical protein [Waterburya agarophytonicola]MCC0177848.1 hypothetical protein [Waterburya agarophytonicola KI4]